MVLDSVAEVWVAHGLLRSRTTLFASFSGKRRIPDRGLVSGFRGSVSFLVTSNICTCETKKFRHGVTIIGRR
jgi:hypothetical protein